MAIKLDIGFCFSLAAVVHSMSHTVGNQQQPLNPPPSGNGSGQMLSPAQAQTGESFYSTASPPQDLNQPPTAVDALTASLSMFILKTGLFYVYFSWCLSLLNNICLFCNLGGNQSSPVSPVHLQHHQNGFAVATVANPYNSGAPQWTGANTLTYTQSMQPPDHRHMHATSYCKLKFNTRAIRQTYFLYFKLICIQSTCL